MGAPLSYVRELRAELGLFPTWFPNDPIELGAFGRMKDGRFVREGSLSDLGITVKRRVGPVGSGFTKRKGVETKLGAEVKAETDLVDASVGVELSIVRDSAWIFACRGDSLVEIENVFDVKNQLLAARRTRTDQWDDAFVVVTAVRRARALAVLVARRAGAKLHALGEGNVAEPEEILLSTKLELRRSASDVFLVRELAKETTPLFELRHVRRGLFKDGLVPMVGRGDEWGFPVVTADDLGAWDEGPLVTEGS